MKIWQCYDNLPAQAWFYTADNRVALTGKGMLFPPIFVEHGYIHIICGFPIRAVPRPHKRRPCQWEPSADVALFNW